MTLIQVELAWSETCDTISQQDLSQCCGMEESDLEELIEYSALVPIELPPNLLNEATPLSHIFSTEWIAPLREVGKMRADFDLDLFTAALLLTKIKHIEVLERSIRVLQAKIPFHAN